MKNRQSSLSFRLVILFTASLVYVAVIPCIFAQAIIGSTDSWGPDGFFCFKSYIETNNETFVEIHLMRFTDGKVKQVFSEQVTPPGYSPICLSSGVIDVTADGVIRKFNLNGENVFEVKPKGFQGASAMSGKIGNRCIFLTETFYDNRSKNLLYHLYLVDVSGIEPIVRNIFNIFQPLKIVRTSDEIIIIGRNDESRLKIPENCKD
jgi:hypothetical protein